MKMQSWLVAAAAAMLLAGCGSPQHNEHDAGHRHPSGDIRETTASVAELPTFLDGLHANIAQVYAIAGQHAELLDGMPCYCGCGDIAGHRSNKNCFIHEIKEDGSVVWDDHGTRCGVCMEIVVQAAKMNAEGKSAKEIRQAIDEAYKEGYAEPTPTPMPA